MSEWREYKLGEKIFSNKQSIGKDYAYSKIIYLDTGSITRGKIENLQEFELSDAPSRAKRLVKHNDIVYSTVRPIQRHYGIINQPPENFVVSTGFSVIESKKDEIDPLYLYYFLTSDETVKTLDIIAEASTSAYPSLKPSDIEKLDILLPPLPEQRAIAAVLSSLDDKIDLLHRQNKTLEAMAKALFRQWFIKEADEDNVTLRDYADNIKNNVKVDKIHNYNNYIGLEHIPRKTITLTNWGMTQDIESNKSAFLKNDILFGKLRSYFHKVIFAPIDGICSTDILVIRPKKKEWFSFCLFWFSSKEVVDHSDLGSSGTRMPRTNWKIVSEYNIPTPDIMRITIFNEITSPFIEKILNNIFQIQLLETLRDQLLPKLITREYRISQEVI